MLGNGTARCAAAIPIASVGAEPVRPKQKPRCAKAALRPRPTHSAAVREIAGSFSDRAGFVDIEFDVVRDIFVADQQLYSQMGYLGHGSGDGGSRKSKRAPDSEIAQRARERYRF
jgi:hypothetical protein